MSVLYKPGERIGTVGYVILAIMIVPLLVAMLAAIVLNSWRRYLELDCTWCGRSFYSTDMPAILATGRCPDCGHPVPGEDFQDLEGLSRRRD
jgi:DNA-directed RNA polymerase subunit RPC12/RpoP